MKRIGIIGGGFFGLYLAEHFARKGAEVHVLEREDACMKRASFVNQARVHNGYHYPRSVLTALRSRVSYPRFCKEFPDCLDQDFEKYYLVGKILSKVTARQFERFCERIGASCEPAPKRITRLVNPSLIEAVFTTRECAFDALKLRDAMLGRVQSAGVHLHLKTHVASIAPQASGLEVCVRGTEGADPYATAERKLCGFDHVFNCTYAMLNRVAAPETLEVIPLKHELTEMCLVEVPDSLKNTGLTVMCGPFFSVMPFPSAKLHSFSHVRYTPHASWMETAENIPSDSPYVRFNKAIKKTAWSHIVHDAARYIPVLAECRYERSIWDVKTVLPKSETDDSRPILFKPNHGITGYHCVMGGKIDNVYDAIDMIKTIGLDNG